MFVLALGVETNLHRLSHVYLCGACVVDAHFEALCCDCVERQQRYAWRGHRARVNGPLGYDGIEWRGELRVADPRVGGGTNCACGIAARVSALVVSRTASRPDLRFGHV